MKDNLPKNFEMKALGLSLVLIGLSILTLPVIESIQAKLNQHRLERLWIEALQKRTFRLRMGKESFEFPKGFPKAEIIVPSIGLRARVMQGADEEMLNLGPGHISGTANPGEVGNCCIAGHRNVYGAWFRRLDELNTNEKIIIRTVDGDFTYLVTEKIEVSPNEGRVLDQTNEPVLTLITCTPVVRPANRLIVKAKLAN